MLVAFMKGPSRLQEDAHKPRGLPANAGPDTFVALPLQSFLCITGLLGAGVTAERRVGDDLHVNPWYPRRISPSRPRCVRAQPRRARPRRGRGAPIST